MGEDRFTEIREVFEEMAGLPVGEREPALGARCAGDAELLDEVRSLLEADSESGDMFGWSPAERVLASDDQSRVGERVGEYTLVRRLGAGGMGEVWLAEHRIDDAIRRVAVKFIRRGLDTENVVRRFRRERRVLGGLEHPCIASLFDGGTAEDGRPFLVMEYVEGTPIDEYCTEHGLGLEERLNLFARVCDAVHFAHQTLVVHRDLKPDHILVTEHGDPKLLDFGIALMLTPNTDAALTVTGQRVFTPRYASPEQVRGEPVTTSTDVYSLGVVLFGLLAGCGPFEGIEGEKSLETAICEREPTRPSLAAATGDASRLRRRLAGDLDTIVLMAMRKEPERRYASAEQFADDIRRHLKGLPVRARTDTLGYRTRKFASRHAVSLSGVAVTVVALVVGVVVFGYLYRDASLARAAESVARASAESRAAEAEQTSAFFAKMLGSVSPGFAKGRDMTVIREVLDRASDTVATELAEFPQSEATLRTTIGNTYLLLGDHDRAGLHLEAALALNVRLHGGESLEVAAVWHKLSALAEGMGEYARAGDLLGAQIPIRERENDRVGLADVWIGQARLASIAGDLPAVLDKAGRALDVYDEERGSKSQQYVRALMMVAAANTQLGRFPEAEQDLVRAVALWNEIEGPMHPNTIISEANLAMLLRQLGRNAEAEELLVSVVERAEVVLGSDHPLTIGARTSLAQTLSTLGRFDEAEAQARAALSTLRETLGDRHPSTLHTQTVLGSALRGGGHLDEAIVVLRESLELKRDVMGADAPSTNATATVLGAALIEGGAEHWAEAEALLTEAVDRLATLGGPDFPLTKNAVAQLRILYAPGEMDRPDKLTDLDTRFGHE